MADQPTFEIPTAMRDMAEKNVEQTRHAYSQFLEMARQAQQLVAKSTESATDSARDVQSKALRYAEENVQASFSFASDLARARDLNEFMTIQTRYAQRQMQHYTEQAQELGKLVADAAQKAGKS